MMMDWGWSGMGVFMGLWGLLVLVPIILSIAALIKYLRS